MAPLHGKTLSTAVCYTTTSQECSSGFHIETACHSPNQGVPSSMHASERTRDHSSSTRQVPCWTYHAAMQGSGWPVASTTKHDILAIYQDRLVALLMCKDCKRARIHHARLLTRKRDSSRPVPTRYHATTCCGVSTASFAIRRWVRATPIPARSSDG